MPEVWILPLPMCKAFAATVSSLRKGTVRVRERALRGLRSAPMRLREEEKGKSEACRRQGSCHPTHGMHHVLAPGWYSYVRPAVHGIVVWQTAGVLQGDRK